MIRTKKHTVIPESQFVIPDLIRDPVLHHHWIAGQARNDKGIRNDKGTGNDNAVSVVVGRCQEFRKHR